MTAQDSGPHGVANSWDIDAAVTAQQTVMSYRQERKAIEIVFVVYLNAPGETGAGITSGDQADQHAVHIDLVAIRSGSSAETPAVWKARIDRSIQRVGLVSSTIWIS